MNSEIRNFEPLREALLDTVEEVCRFMLLADLPTLSGYHDLSVIQKALDDQTRDIDVKALDIIMHELKQRLPGTSALVVSEERPLGEPLLQSSDLPDLLFIVDPIDNTDGAVHGDAAYTAICLYSRQAQQVIAAAVGDPALKKIYYADESLDAARSYALFNRTQFEQMCPTWREKLPGSYIAIYTYKPGRLLEVNKAATLIRMLGDHGRVHCVGGAASLCRVAAGYIDAAVEFIKGFQSYDLFPGAYVLRKAGGICSYPTTMEGFPLRLSIGHQNEIPEAVKERRKFIATGSTTLFHAISVCLVQDKLFEIGTTL